MANGGTQATGLVSATELAETKRRRHREQLQVLGAVFLLGGVFYMALLLFSNYDGFRLFFSNDDESRGDEWIWPWTIPGRIPGWQWNANLTNADALLVLTALLALVASLTIAVTATTWRGHLGSETDETTVQLWTMEISVVGRVGAALSIAVAATRAGGSGGYGVVLISMAGITAWLAVATVQRTRDTVPLRIALRDTELALDTSKRSHALVKGYRLDVNKWRLRRRVAGCFLLAATPIAMGVGVRFVFGEPTGTALDSARGLLMLLWPTAWWLWQTYLPRLKSSQNWLSTAGAMVVIGLVLLLSLLLVLDAFTPKPDSQDWVGVINVGGLVAGVVAFWVMLSLGKRSKGLGRALYEYERSRRHSHLVRLEKRKQELMRKLNERAAESRRG